MNTLIRHFATLINRLIAEVGEIGKRLTDIAVNVSKLTLNKSDGANGENTSSDQKSTQKQNESESRIMGTEVHFKSEEVNRYYADGNKPNWVEIMAVVVGITTLFAVVFYAVINFFMLKEMRFANQAAQTSFNQTLTQMQVQSGAQQTAANAQMCAAIAAGKAAKAMTDQVDKLQAGVDQTKSLAKATRDAIDSNIRLAEEDRRPWVGLQMLQCKDCRIDTASFTIGELSGFLINTGKTPAADMMINYTFESIPPDFQIPTYESIEKENATNKEKMDAAMADMYRRLPLSALPEMNKTMEIIKRIEAPSLEALAPNAPRQVIIIQRFKQSAPTPKPGGFPRPNIQDQNIIYGLGKVTYFDTARNTQHTTTFCVMRTGGEDSFRFCPTGNDMN